MLTSIVAAIFVFGLLVLAHELGHFVTAKMVGMRVDEFALGFGPKLISYRRGETVYSLRMIPLGGFNKIAGMDPEEEQDDRSFYAKSVPARMLVIVAGSLMNFVLPILLFMIVYLSIGIDMPSKGTVIGEVFANKPAAVAGLEAGDRVVAVNGTAVDTWQQFVSVIQVNANKQLEIQFEHAGALQTAMIMPELDEKGQRGIIGVMQKLDNYRPGVGEAAKIAVEQTYYIAVSMVNGIWQMVTGKVSAELAGPVGVAKMAGEVAQIGFMPLLKFAAFLSLNLGIINLLPIPALDGGHLVTLALEGLRGRALDRKYLGYLQMVGFFLLITLFLFVTFQDLSRLEKIQQLLKLLL